MGTRLDIGLYGPTWGQTDSELVFRWILNRMGRYGLDPESPADDLHSILSLIEDSLSELIRFGIEAGIDRQPSMTFIISDGRHLVASRWGSSLFWTFRRGVSDYAFCESSHCEHADETYKAVVVASEPITNEHWLEVPEGRRRQLPDRRPPPAVQVRTRAAASYRSQSTRRTDVSRSRNLA